MIGMKYLAPAVAALLLTAVAAWSQPLPDAEGDATTTAPQQNPGPNTDIGDAAADTAPSQTGRSPGDYRASEQISEDLSVSFPVDI